jgi:hypothetical protein
MSCAVSFFKVNTDLKMGKFSHFFVLQAHIWQQHGENKHNLTVNYVFYFEIWFGVEQTSQSFPLINYVAHMPVTMTSQVQGQMVQFYFTS